MSVQSFITLGLVLSVYLHHNYFIKPISSSILALNELLICHGKAIIFNEKKQEIIEIIQKTF
jgi:hypothetical protein